jgi:hypothetical protein
MVATLPGGGSLSVGPTVETGLPVARHDPAGTTISYGNAPALPLNPTTSYRTPIASTIPPLSPDSGLGPTHPGHGSGSTHAGDDFIFTNFEKKTHTYPWKTNIITTVFWIGEGDTPISRTTNEQSAWDEEWRRTNGGADRPDDRDGYAAGGHASMVNPFYVALPFNDLAFPDKARIWMPSWWHRSPKNGKPVSACQHRWVEIKNAQGDTCYAQWEDVGPLRYDHAEYVFGSERPDTYTRAGLDVSPAVAQYLNINERNRYTSWRFVDDEDVRPGQWLKLDEQAVLYTALQHQLKNPNTPSSLPIQRAIAPLDDPSSVDDNKKKVGAAKG